LCILQCTWWQDQKKKKEGEGDPWLPTAEIYVGIHTFVRELVAVSETAGKEKKEERGGGGRRGEKEDRCRFRT